MSAQGIIDFARQFIGSHYLWGSGGDTPDGRNGIWYLKEVTRLAPPSTDPKAPMVFAAQCDSSGHFVCSGRFRDIDGGRYADPNDWDLQNYLAGLAPLPLDLWCPYFVYFSPRVMQGRNLSNSDSGRIVWGEDCRGIRHFDCISFVNWVLTGATKPNWPYNITQYQNNTSWRTTPVDLDAPAVAGDILLRHVDHIALLTAEGTVIQAEEHAHGVHENERYAPSRWTGRLRVAQQLF